MLDLGLFEQPFIKSKLDMAIQELDILFNTTCTELIGRPDFGTNFLQFLWVLTPNVDSLKRYIEEKIEMNTLYLREFDYYLDVTFISDVSENIYVVKFYIETDTNNVIQKTFTIY